ncbi:hypothetical protein CLOSTMETH_01395 [[Clostridium] methylpentosum DSM 5476]|uniref:Uncharacterized protein n=1 Tax=[Clostridium] methylpentosum DSM 5476 TaxID=537013 RepID=C0EC27_9FIRM|nr:hypothetical protein CLOSTMETH_01395 [[Clostridium] methylpentosum DSM 5476]
MPEHEGELFAVAASVGQQHNWPEQPIGHWTGEKRTILERNLSTDAGLCDQFLKPRQNLRIVDRGGRAAQRSAETEHPPQVIEGIHQKSGAPHDDDNGNPGKMPQDPRGIPDFRFEVGQDMGSKSKGGVGIDGRRGLLDLGKEKHKFAVQRDEQPHREHGPRRAEPLWAVAPAQDGGEEIERQNQRRCE